MVDQSYLVTVVSRKSLSVTPWDHPVLTVAMEVNKHLHIPQCENVVSNCLNLDLSMCCCTTVRIGAGEVAGTSLCKVGETVDNVRIIGLH